MAKDDSPCTMRSLADAVGVSVMTVSRALRNAPEVGAATRQRILEAARRLGYRPDPVLSALSEYRRNRSPKRPTREALAFLTSFATRDGWRDSATFRRYFDGAGHRAHELGYQLTPFWLCDPELTARRATQILIERGIRGLLVGPLPSGATTLALEWRRFSAVCLGRSLREPSLTQVCPHHAQVVRLALREVFSRGYRRVGLVISESEDARTDHAVRSAYQFLRQGREEALAEPWVHADGESPRLSAWTRDQKLEVILTSEERHEGVITAEFTGARRPRVVHLNISDGSAFPGVSQEPDRIGMQAVSLLHLKLLQREVGVPAIRDLLMIEGVWREGRPPWSLSKSAKRFENSQLF